MVQEIDCEINAIFVDVGETMRTLVKDERCQAQAQRQLVALTGTTESPERFYARLNERYDEYHKWALDTMIEASEDFKSVLVSSVFGRRKPAPEIHRKAVRRAGVQAAQSAYIGNNPQRDVVGARQAGFGMAVILTEPEALATEPPIGETMPDAIIHKFGDLLNIFPAR